MYLQINLKYFYVHDHCQISFSFSCGFLPTENLHYFHFTLFFGFKQLKKTLIENLKQHLTIFLKRILIFLASKEQNWKLVRTRRSPESDWLNGVPIQALWPGSFVVVCWYRMKTRKKDIYLRERELKASKSHVIINAFVFPRETDHPFATFYTQTFFSAKLRELLSWAR